MESSTFLPVSNFSLSPPKPHCYNRTLPLNPSKKTSSTIQCKMYVPGFGEASPEKKAAKHLQDFFTYIAVRIVDAQLESYNTEAHAELTQFMETHSLNDGDKFCAELMRVSSRHKALALRIIEVRSSYCKEDFEWDNLKLLASKMVDERNTRLMRDYVRETTTSVDNGSDK